MPYFGLGSPVSEQQQFGTRIGRVPTRLAACVRVPLLQHIKSDPATSVGANFVSDPQGRSESVSRALSGPLPCSLQAPERPSLRVHNQTCNGAQSLMHTRQSERPDDA